MNSFIYLLKRFVTPIERGTVLFSSFSGRFNDNPKYLIEALHDVNASIKIVCANDEKGKDVFPDYCICVKPQSKEYYNYLLSAQVIVDNYSGLGSVKVSKEKYLKNLFLRLSTKLRPDQLCISTWHGTPLKKIALDEPGGDRYQYYNHTDYLLSGCKYTTACLKSCFNDCTPIREYGTPRNDILLSQNNTDNLKKKLGLPLNRKIILFAPTFRNDINQSGLTQMHELEIPVLLKALESKFGGEWSFVFRVHALVADRINTTEICASDKSLLINGNEHDDMAEYLSCADILLNDYSSSMFDFALTGKPCFIYATDILEYGSEERGFYMNLRELPFPIAESPKELLDNVKNFNEVDYKVSINRLLSKLGNIEDGHASKRVVNKILEFINKGSK